ncbi:hypothetical protein TIFTF001_055818, partial [Ficus carica]
MTEVSTLAEYENCTNQESSLANRIIASLLANGSRFFLCTVDKKCELGMKTIITVRSRTNTYSALVPPARDDSSSAPSLTFAEAIVTTFSLKFLSSIMSKCVPSNK